MRALLVALLLAGTALAIVPSASANPCHVTDLGCMVECLLDSPCGIYRPIHMDGCDDGVGRVIHVGGSEVPVCV